MKKSSVIAYLFIFIVTLFCSHAYAETDKSYVIDESGRREIPLAYSVTNRIVSFDASPATLEEPEDICIGKDDSLYILDSGHSRVVKFDEKGNFVRIIKPDGDIGLSAPEGIFVDGNDRILVADTGNGRIVIMDQAGAVENILTQPDSQMFDKEYPFKPAKLGVDSLGQIFAINKDDYHGLCILDENNGFQGYFATNRVSHRIADDWIAKLASSSQREQIGKTIPPQHTNLSIACDGSIYVTTANVESAQVKRLSVTGTNFYPFTGTFGDSSEENQRFVDVASDMDGVVTVLENTSGNIYQYDEFGVMLSVFGGSGSWKGKMMNAAALAQNSSGQLFVLDKTTGDVQIFTPTEFTRKVHAALAYHNNGDYENAAEIWESIHSTAHNYSPAYVGLAKVAYKQKDYITSMKYFKLAEDRKGYSDSFVKYQKQIIQQHFPLVVLTVLLLSSALIYLVIYLKKKADYANQPDVMLHDGRSIALVTMFAPWDAFRLIKYDRSRFYPLTPTMILCSAVAVRLLSSYVYSYQTTGADPQEVNPAAIVFSFLVPFALWCIGYYYVSGIFDGAVMLREVYSATCYALLPFAVFGLPIALLSNTVGMSSVSFLNSLTAIIWIWVIILVFLGVKTMNRIGTSRTVTIMILSTFAAIFIALVITFLYLLGIQLFDFLREVIRECRHAL